ncbi:Anti-sigma-E factor ChrR [Vibrio aerogenes CECT 7868]|uniref:Anti-sigma-E factor ChrR n=1 Tax=Vibrio aerogenes CECT 7868 TaxID=1216006 RepID=A0A1M6A4J0_9VIBR|nr:ChrR family anti-sigma-E factor [Vibrio aerogenes]SHI31444.1 Anti-sigma-E factor ChrR [Vibrio aerogenes CECT 7868]
MTKIQYHPTDDTLSRYAAGELDPASCIMLSAHLEFCSQCRQKVTDYENIQARQMMQNAPEPLSDELTHMLSGILKQTPVKPVDPECQTVTAETHTQFLKVNHKSFRLPRALKRHESHIGPWSRLPGNIKRANVTTGGQSKMNFIYMDCNSSLPQHTHQGSEITLVLAGEFHDEHATYYPGDFVLQNDHHIHTPKTSAEQDCLCLTLLDAPLRFTSGLATLLNPFSPIFFR